MKKCLFLLLPMLLLAWDSLAQDFVYRPKNPAFGGDTFQYQWLLSSAQAQNKIEDETLDKFPDSFGQDPLKSFADNLNRQILSELSRRVVTSIFGEETLEEGVYEIGSYQIEVTESIDGVNIRIFDVSTGNEAAVLVPYF